MPLIVNGEEVPEAAIAQEAQSLMQRFQQLTPEQRAQNGFDDATMQARADEWARENLIERALMRQQAAADPEPVPEEPVEAAVAAMTKRFGGEEKFEEAGVTPELIRSEAELSVRLDRLLAKVTAPVKDAKTKDVAAFYRKHKDRFLIGESVRAAHIVKHVNEDVTEDQAKQAIDDAQRRLDSGEEFEKLADEFSDCPGSGGDLGWFPRGKMVEEFENVVFEMEPGDVSKPFQSVFGFHIAKLHEKRPATHRPLDEVKGDIQKQLRQERETKIVEDYVDALKEKAEIVNTPSEVVTTS